MLKDIKRAPQNKKQMTVKFHLIVKETHLVSKLKDEIAKENTEIRSKGK